jgi:hypothetical protein
MLFNQINDYVTMFLKENGDQSILGAWNENLEDFKEKFQTKVNKANKSKKSKKPKDAPKGALSAYILFGKEIRDQIKEDEPDFDSKEIMREQGRRWAKLKETQEEEVDRLNLLAKEDKLRYKKEMENYSPIVSDDDDNENDKKKRVKKDPNAPKGAKNAYLYYCEANRSLLKEDNPDMTGKEIQKELAEQWKALKEEDPEEAEIYIKMANDDKERFIIENAEYIGESPKKISKKVAEKAVAKKAVKKVQEEKKVTKKVPEKKVVAKVPEKKVVKKVVKKVIVISEDEDDE